ncbi:hypothetical protein D3C84_1081040 [compost metagenome]
MILEPCEQLDGFAAIAFKHRIVDDKDGIPFRRRKRVDLLHRGNAERRQKTTPSKAGMMEKAVHRILAGHRIALITLQQAKPVLLME